MLSRTMRRRGLVRLAATVALGMIWCGCAGATPDTLEVVARGVRIDPDRISVSGISSGGFMAHQFHVAHSDHVMGAGIVAGGPFYCARGNLIDAVTRCSQFVKLDCEAWRFGDLCKLTNTSPQNPAQAKAMAAESFADARKQERAGTIAKLANLQGDKVYLFSGAGDTIVPQGVMAALNDFYVVFAKAALKEDDVRHNHRFPAPHTMVRDDYIPATTGAIGTCPQNVSGLSTKSTFIDDCEPVAKQQATRGHCVCDAAGAGGGCAAGDDPAGCRDLNDVDLAGAILRQIYGTQALQKGRSKVAEDEIQAFDQKGGFDGLNAMLNASMAREGYIFIPAACRTGRACPLHIAFHGCLQGGKSDGRPGHSGNLFSKFAGYNEWAKANDIVVLYPQADKGKPPVKNPQGCWDWWGQDYTHQGYHTQRGRQIKAVAQMVNSLASRPLLAVPK